ncbi:MAG TPA: TraR/DksA C4-type zinc finger protein [Mycobacteriales bacterium]|nr:TraR/DksA C4-type zinc finger protein [Mycobacteriales bacterium]
MIEDRLAAEREQALAQIAALSAERTDVVAGRDLVATDDEHDPEGATIAFEHARLGALLLQARQRVVAVDRAQERLRAGVLHLCERCGSEIPPERRDARPTATTCLTCATRR